MKKSIFFILMLLPTILYAQGQSIKIKTESGNLNISQKAKSQHSDEQTGLNLTVPYSNSGLLVRYTFEEISKEDDDTAVIYGKIRVDRRIKKAIIVNAINVYKLKEGNSPAIYISSDSKKNTIIEYLIPVKKDLQGGITIAYPLHYSLIGKTLKSSLEFKYYKMPKWRGFLRKHGITLTEYTLSSAGLATGVAISAKIVTSGTPWGWVLAAGTLFITSKGGYDFGKILGDKVEQAAKEPIKKIKEKYEGELLVKKVSTIHIGVPENKPKNKPRLKRAKKY